MTEQALWAQAARRAPAVAADVPDDATLVAQVRGGDLHAFELLMRRHNRRMFRTARSVVRDADEAEDIVQEAYVRAWLRLAELTRPAGFAAWVARITVNEAYMRLRRSRRLTLVGDEEQLEMATSDDGARSTPGPEQLAGRAQLRGLIEAAIDALPQPFRSVFVLRMVEQLDTAETAYCLDLPPATVKTRLHRARLLLQRQLAEVVDTAAADAFEFGGTHCDRVVAQVLARIRGEPQPR
ncbi:MAG: RNA polymerase sigma factor [Thiohalobacteraceae bacterium]